MYVPELRGYLALSLQSCFIKVQLAVVKLAINVYTASLTPSVLSWYWKIECVDINISQCVSALNGWREPMPAQMVNCNWLSCHPTTNQFRPNCSLCSHLGKPLLLQKLVINFCHPLPSRFWVQLRHKLKIRIH